MEINADAVKAHDSVVTAVRKNLLGPVKILKYLPLSLKSNVDIRMKQS